VDVVAKPLETNVPIASQVSAKRSSRGHRVEVNRANLDTELAWAGGRAHDRTRSSASWLLTTRRQWRTCGSSASSRISRSINRLQGSLTITALRDGVSWLRWCCSMPSIFLAGLAPILVVLNAAAAIALVGAPRSLAAQPPGHAPCVKLQVPLHCCCSHWVSCDGLVTLT
jgi:hypothetical protein